MRRGVGLAFGGGVREVWAVRKEDVLRRAEQFLEGRGLPFVLPGSIAAEIGYAVPERYRVAVYRDGRAELIKE